MSALHREWTRLRRRWAAWKEAGENEDWCRSRSAHAAAGARIVAAQGIRIGKGTRLGENAIVAANCYGFSSAAFRAEPQGEIRIGENCRILPGAILAAYHGFIHVGKNVSVNFHCVLYGHGGLTIGDDTRIAAGTVIIPSNHGFSDPTVPVRLQPSSSLGIRIGRDVWIGTGVRILDGVELGDGCVVGAGSVVTKTFPPHTILAGVPARKIGER